MKTCIQEASLTPPPGIGEEVYHPQFFFCKNETGKCLTGEVREIVTSVLQTRQPTFMQDESWIAAARKPSNPFSRNFFLKHICMNRIASGALKVVDKRLDSMPFYYFEDLPNWSKITYQGRYDRKMERYLFIAEQTFYIGVDGVASCLDKEKGILDLFFIQVGYTPETHRADESFFLQYWSTVRQSINNHQYAAQCNVRVSFLHIGDQKSSKPFVPVQRKIAGEEFELEYHFYDISLSILDDRLR